MSQAGDHFSDCEPSRDIEHHGSADSTFISETGAPEWVERCALDHRSTVGLCAAQLDSRVLNNRLSWTVISIYTDSESLYVAPRRVYLCAERRAIAGVRLVSGNPKF